MRTTSAEVSGRQRFRLHLDEAIGGVRCRELAASLATAVIVSQLLFAQAALAIAIVLVLIGRVSRWRPAWLVPVVLVSLGWLMAIGPAKAATAYAAGSRRLADHLVAHPEAVVSALRVSLPRELPLAVALGCGEAWLMLWLGWWRRRGSAWDWRPGLIALLRRRLSTAALAAGRTVTADGCALGLVPSTGKLVGISWAEVADGLLLTGTDADDVGLAVVAAALRRRTTVLILERAGTSWRVGRDAVTDRVRGLAGALVLPVTDVTDHSRASAAIGRAIRRRETVLIEVSEDAAARAALGAAANVLRGLRELGLHADCVAWVVGCEYIDSASLAELGALGRLTGTAVMLSTTSPGHVATLASDAGVAILSGQVGTEVARSLSAHEHAGPLRQQRQGEFTMLTSAQAVAWPDRGWTVGRVIPISLGSCR